MERDLKPLLLGYIEKANRLEKKLSALRQNLTKLLYSLPRDVIPPIELPKGKVFSHKEDLISETLSSSPSRYKRRKKLDLDDFIDALEKAGMNVGQQMPQMSYLIGAQQGSKLQVNGDIISVFQYKAPFEWRRSLEAVANANLMMYKQEQHKDWKSILKIFKSL